MCILCGNPAKLTPDLNLNINIFTYLALPSPHEHEKDEGSWCDNCRGFSEEDLAALLRNGIN